MLIVHNIRLQFAFILAVLLGAHLCHVAILWPEEGLPLAAANQILEGKILYRDIWFDKPPLLAWSYLLWGAQTGVALRVAGALYTLFACWLIYRFARDLWGAREGLAAAGLLAFYVVFYLPSAVIPLAADLLMVTPHVAAVWLAWRARPFWSGVVAGVAFLINPKGLLVVAACAAVGDWSIGTLWRLALGFAAPCTAAAAWLAIYGALTPYYEQVWKWGRVYAGRTFASDPLRNGLIRTVNWLGFHSAAIVAAIWFWWYEKDERWRWGSWALIALAAAAMGLRFFPRYFFQVLPVLILMAARGWVLMGRKRAAAVALLLLIPLVRFGPRYVMLARDLVLGQTPQWADIAMDQDSREAARLVRELAHPGDTLFVWGFRPEIYAYTHLRAGTRFLDSQPLTGVPADRHLTDWRPVTPELARHNRAGMMRSHPTFVVDGLGPFNPRLAMEAYPDLRPWLARYRAVARTRETVIYKLFDAPGAVFNALLSGPPLLSNPGGSALAKER